MNWIQPQLGQLLSHSDSGEWGEEDLTNGISVLRSTNMSNDGTVDFGNLTFRAVPNAKRTAKRLEPGDIILENSGGGPKQPVGRVCYFAGHEMQHIVGNFCRRLRPISDFVLPRFLFWRLHYGHCIGDTLRYQTHTTGLRNLQFKSYLNQAIDIPGKTEQRRIVTILDEADRLRRLSRGANAKAARILPALFLNMFGDPATNPKGWDVMPLSKVIASVEAGWSSLSVARQSQNGEKAVLKVSAVTSGVFRPEEHKAVPEVDPSRTLITPRRGDLLFSRANTRELVAATCIVEADYPNLFLPDKLWRITPFQDVAKTTFLKELFWNSGIRDKFRTDSSGSSGSMLNISQSAVLRTEVPIPPISLQEQFDQRAWSVMEIARQAQQSSIRMDQVWSELLQQAFSGQLTSKWREAHMKELLAEMALQARQLNLPLPQEAAV